MFSPSTSSSDSCLICGQKSIGINFGAQSCRACAAFFRRNAVGTDRFSFRCDKGDCGPSDGGKFPCKKCRMNRCLEVGMDPKKFQLNRDVLNTASNFKSVKKRFYELGPSRSMAEFLGRPSSLICCEPDKASHIKTIVDVSPMIRKAEDIFRASSNRPYSSTDALSSLTQGLENMRLNPNLHVLEVIRKNDALRIWEDSFVDTATWLANWQEFRILPEVIQMMITKCGWLLWSKLEHLAQTAEFMKKFVVSKDLLVVGTDVGVDTKKVEMDVSWMTNYSKEQATAFLLIDLNGNFANIIKYLMDLEPSKIELNYMLCHLCLFMAGKRHSDLSDVTERLLELLANDLHQYYQGQKCLSYSLRIAKMMKINNLLIRDSWERNERNQVATVLNLFCIEFSDMEMFKGN